MKVFYTKNAAVVPPIAPEREQGDTTSVAVETLGSIIIQGDRSDPDNIQPDEVQLWHAHPDDMDMTKTMSGDPQVEIIYPDMDEIKEKRKHLHFYKCINDRTRWRIRERYSVEEELKAIRTDDTEHHNWVMQCCAEGDVDKVRFSKKLRIAWNRLYIVFLPNAEPVAIYVAAWP